MRFGILGTAGIARDSFVPAVERSDHEAAAIASRDGDRAREVADEFGIPAAYGEYERLFSADVDAVYNPLPNALHARWTRRAADAGLPVLCEKPLTTDAEAAVDLFDYCEDRDVTMMEGFMYRFHPQTERAREVVADELGDVRSVDATFKFRLPDPPDIRYDPDLGGGALRDAGCYAVDAATGFLGEPDRAYAHAADTRDSGVDTDLTGVLEYEGGRTARVSTSFDTPHVQRYRVECMDGYLESTNPFAPGTSETEITYAVDGDEATETVPGVDQFRREVDHFAECVTRGTAPRVTREESITNARVIDALAESAAEGRLVAVA